MRAVAFVVLAGCGRIAFEPQTVDASTAESGDVAPAHLILDFALDADPRVDSGPGQHDATCSMCPTAAVDTMRGTVGMFNGSQCLHITDAPDLKPTAFTVTAWAQWAGGMSEIFSRPLEGVADLTNTYELYMDPTGVVFYVNSMSRVGTAPALNEWHHFAGVFDGSDSLLYIDGVAVMPPRTVGSMIFSNQGLYIGCDLDFGAEVQPFNGKLDAVHLYDVALTPSEILADMNR